MAPFVTVASVVSAWASEAGAWVWQELRVATAATASALRNKDVFFIVMLNV
jgi:hypothetical protein